jgi:hypothetical protein
MRRFRRPWTISAVLVTGVAIAAAVFYAVSPSAFMKRFTPRPKGELIVFSGGADRGRILDGGGGWINGGRFTEIVIRSEWKDGRWERPDGVVIRNGKLRGSIRVVGLGRNGEAEGVRDSSTSPGHTERAQEAAPRGVVISGLGIEADRAIPVYLAPGVTGAVIEDCHFTGWTVTGAIYLDAESAGNTIRNNRFATKCYREVICVDGSTVRHQTPRENVIRDNDFALGTLGFGNHAIWLGSRNGRRSYCHLDDGYPFGSSLDNRDFANANVVTDNAFDPPGAEAIRDEGEGNVVSP